MIVFYKRMGNVHGVKRHYDEGIKGPHEEQKKVIEETRREPARSCSYFKASAMGNVFSYLPRIS